MYILCVEKGSICNQKYHKLYYFSQIPPIHLTPKVCQGNIPTSLPCFVTCLDQQKLSECELRHAPGEAWTHCAAAPRLPALSAVRTGLCAEGGSFRLGLRMRRHLGRAELGHGHSGTTNT